MPESCPVTFYSNGDVCRGNINPPRPVQQPCKEQKYSSTIEKRIDKIKFIYVHFLSFRKKKTSTKTAVTAVCFKVALVFLLNTETLEV